MPVILGGNTGIYLASLSPVTPFTNQYSMLFDGVDEYAKGSSTFSELDGGNKFTLSMWVKPTSFAAARILFHIPRNTTPNNSQLLLRLDTAGNLDFSIDTISYYIRTLSVSLTLNVWNHILVCVDLTNPTNSQKGRIYINSVDATSSVNISSRTAFSTSTGAVWLGEEANGYLNPFLGNMDEVAIWTSDERANVADIYNSGVPSDLSQLTTPPSHWWRMGDGDAFSTDWTFTDNAGSYNLASVNMEVGDRVTDVP